MSKRYELEAASGRGLQLVEALSERFGTHRIEAGKRVWCEVAWETA